MYKLSVQDVENIKAMRLHGANYFKIGQTFNISFQHAQAVCAGKRKSRLTNADLPEEHWFLVESWPILEASNLGRVRRRETKRVFTVHQTSKGYNVIGFSYQGKKFTKLVHRLVTEAWLGMCPSGYTVNHKDGNKSNNQIDNLEYLTLGDNDKHAYRIGLKSAQGEQNGRAKLTEEDVRQIRQTYYNGAHYKEIADKFQIHPRHCLAIIRKVFWRHV